MGFGGPSPTCNSQTASVQSCGQAACRRIRHLGQPPVSAVFTRGPQTRGGPRSWFFRGLFCACALVLNTAEPRTADAADGRTESGQLALYRFDSGKGKTIKDRSAVSPPLDLTIENAPAVTWSRGGLVVRSATKIASTRPARKITDAVKRSGGLTIEAWIKPASDRQNGPARIVSLSADSGQRNLTLGQDGKRYDVRLRTTATSTNGIPSTASG